jgi:hypothetical protein
MTRAGLRASMSDPTVVMRPPAMATSARCLGAPVPSTTVPPEMTMS